LYYHTLYPRQSENPSVAGAGEALTVYSGRDEKIMAALIEKAEQGLGMEIEVRYVTPLSWRSPSLRKGRIALPMCFIPKMRVPWEQLPGKVLLWCFLTNCCKR
jgi:hypothetical protein